ncbi:MAG: tetratricopeptide repeat protein [Candidatus Aminicenantes bacterium]|nr:tetratricopeptide repeat protein [Candidatus Aminicenantes bacterium]
MKKNSMVLAVFVVLSLCLGLFAVQSGQDLFQKALAKERAEGNLEEAILLYQKVIDESQDNSLKAQAQLRIGLCFEKLGQQNSKQALDAYQKVINNYPLQSEEVRVAKEKLSLLQKAQSAIKKGDKEFTLRKVCSDPDVDTLGEVSPDGSYISYTDWGTGDLAIYEITTGKKKQLTKLSDKESFGFVLRSPWSPDSNQIAYNWYNEEGFWELRIIGTNSSEPRVLYRDKDVYPQPADWSPDGKSILTIFDNYYKDKISQVGLVSVEDGAVSILETLKGRGVYYLYFSPDGRYIAYDYPPKKDSQDGNIFVFSIEEKNEIPLIQHSAHDYLLGWTPDGKSILYGSDRMGTPDVWIISVEEGKPQGVPTRTKTDIGLIFPMEFAPDGSFYYGRRIEIRDVYIGILDKERRKPLASPEILTGRFVGANFSPEWSPDGKYLAYISTRHPEHDYGSNSLYIRDLETDEEREVVRPQQIRAFGGVSRSIRWSPDGRSILASGVDKKGQGLYMTDVKTGEMTIILYGEAQIMYPSWSADGKAIFFTERDFQKGISRVFRYDIASEQKKEIYHQNPNLLCLIPSPDGKTLAFLMIEKDNSNVIKILPVEGGEPREVTKIAEGYCMTMAWTHDGREILFCKNVEIPETQGQAERSELWTISVEGGEPQNLWKFEGPGAELSVHPDGQRIAFSSRKMNNEIWVMENFLPRTEDKK